MHKDPEKRSDMNIKRSQELVMMVQEIGSR